MIHTTTPALFLLAAALCLGPQPEAVLDNNPPVCNAGGDITLVRQGTVTTVFLDGSGSFDPDGDPLTFLWTTGCPGAQFADATAPQTVLSIATPDPNAQVDCSVRLRVRDSDDGVSFCRLFITITSGTLKLHLDIKPGSCPNPLNVESKGVVLVSVLGTLRHSVTLINPNSLCLARADGVGSCVAPVSVKTEDTGTIFVNNGPDPCDCHDLTGDGVPDLSMKFNKLALINGLGLAALPDKSYVRLELRGQLLDGTPFAAQDCIRIAHKGD